MRANIYANLTLIGHTDLLIGDESMGHLYGEFIPTPPYYTEVQGQVWKLGQLTITEDNQWPSLNLNAQLANGYFLFPQGGYTIDDSPDYPHEPKRIDIAGVAAAIIDDFVKSEPPRPFVEEPWVALDIKQKIALEIELQRELGDDIRLPSTAKVRAHPLASCQFSALCRFGPSDDVLFQIKNKKDPQNSFAVVHLTWLGEQEHNLNFPLLTFYESFDEFKFYRLYPDKVAWED